MPPLDTAKAAVGSCTTFAKRGVIAAILVFVAILFFTSFAGTVGAGERGIRLRFGAVTGESLPEGLYFKIPMIERVVIMDVKIQKAETEATAASKDLQTVSSIVALNYHLDPSRVGDIYQEVGIFYAERLIAPSLQESVKASTAKFTAEELVTKREAVREEIKTALRAKLENQGIMVDEFNIVDFQFSVAFDQAIEAKVTAEQSALAAKNKLEQVKFEAEQRIAEAKGKAEAIRVESDALRDNPMVLQLRALEKWDGVLPLVQGGQTMPFIDLNSLRAQ